MSVSGAGVVSQELPERKRVFLQPGFLHLAIAPSMIVTILGSCVSVCLWDRRRQTGGANHFLLPIQLTGEPASPRYGEVAMTALIQGLVRQGSAMPDLVAHVYGGACVLQALRGRADHLGLRNAELATQMLNANRIRIARSDVGGERARKVAFDTFGGLTSLKYV